MENTFASPAFKALTWHWSLIGNAENCAGTVFPAECGLDMNLDFIRSPYSQDNTEGLMTSFSVITETHGEQRSEEERTGRNKNMLSVSAFYKI